MDKKYNNEIESINTFNDTRMVQDLFEQSLDGIVLTDDRELLLIGIRAWRDLRN